MRAGNFLALLGISLFSFTGFLDATIVSTALPAIQDGLHMTVMQLQWVMNAFFLAISAFMASMGRVADIYGRRLILYVGVFIFGLASIGAGLATSTGFLIVCRILQGVTTAITIPVGVALINTLFDAKEMSKAMGLFAALTGAGLALGPVLGGILVTHFGWPSIFFINIPFIVLGFVLCVAKVKESRSDDHTMTLDIAGVIFLALTIVSFVFGLVEADNYGWSSMTIVSSFIVSFISLIVFIFVERYASHPIVTGDLFKNKVFIGSALFMFIGGGAMAIVLFIDPLYLSVILEKSDLMTGILLFIISISVVISSPIIGHYMHRIGTKNMMLLGVLLYFVSALLHIIFPVDFSYILIIPAFVIFGIAWGICNTTPAVALSHSLSEKEFSVGIGALFSFFNIGATVFLAIGTVLYHHFAIQHLMSSLAAKNMLTSPDQLTTLKDYLAHPNEFTAFLAYLHHVNTQLGSVLPSQYSAKIISDVNLANQGTVDLIKSAFTAGLHAMFWPVILLLFLSALLLLLIPKQKKFEESKEGIVPTI